MSVRVQPLVRRRTRGAVGAFIVVVVLAASACGGSDEVADGVESSSAPPSIGLTVTSTVPPTTIAPVVTETATAPPQSSTSHPDVVAANVTHSGDGLYRFDVTISSPYDSAERYADAWRILGADGTVYGVRELTHHHANEQPFTRSLDGVALPDSVTQVTIEGRDIANGWGGGTVEVAIPSGGSG